MKHTFWLVPNRIAGRPGPALAPWSLPELRAAGFGAVLNLSEFEPPRPQLASAGIEAAWVPLPNTCPADAATELACLHGLPKAHAFVRAQLRTGRAVLVHCAIGRDRTGLLLAYHLACSSGLAPAEAIAQIRKVRPGALSAPGWEQMAERVLAQLAAQARA